MWTCMTDHVDDIKDSTCKAYVNAMTICLKDAEKIDGCLTSAANQMVGLRRCLRQVKPEQVSEECRESEFFKSTQHPRW